MKAVVYHLATNAQEQSGFKDVELAQPEAKGRDLLIEVKAVSVNPVDYKVKNKLKQANQQDRVLGWDAAGIVKEVGSEVCLFKPGDEVWYAGDITRDGSNSEYQLVDERIVGHKPKTIRFEQAAALPLTGITAWELVFDSLALPKDEPLNVLVIGAAGGVGSILLQILKTLTKCHVIASFGREESKQWLLSLGADLTLNHRQNIQAQLNDNKIKAVDAIISLTHTQDYIEQYAEIIAPRGKIAFIDDPQNFNVMAFKPKSVSIHSEFMFTRPTYQTEDMQKHHDILNTLAELVDKKIIQSTAANHFGTINASNLSRAHELIESGKSVGKCVLSSF
ncbi:zinc-binding alcohol dehydrogenase family protein [Legionella israelensis]|uniref:Zinc-type alcohol dehydrogenase-like protein n=1 Tax=Legionella israelensis TaxID=454 RepID=A0AAX1ECT2_9GAMM|nr:zinc-binding alcohol dehydrogenase family protein [Legionella israelensis]QBR82911.1 zinc-binding alcohol dehydrogenase family protein [Legionella israelensis]